MARSLSQLGILMTCSLSRLGPAKYRPDPRHVWILLWNLKIWRGLLVSWDYKSGEVPSQQGRKVPVSWLYSPRAWSINTVIFVPINSHPPPSVPPLLHPSPHDTHSRLRLCKVVRFARQLASTMQPSSPSALYLSVRVKVR